jgi:hypothetical protein
MIDDTELINGVEQTIVLMDSLANKAATGDVNTRWLNLTEQMITTAMVEHTFLVHPKFSDELKQAVQRLDAATRACLEVVVKRRNSRAN